MFNKRLQHDFIIPNAGPHRVYLLEESDTGGTWPVIKGEGMPVTLTTGNRNNTIYTPILPSTLTWRIVIQNQAARDVIDAVFDSIEGDYRVEYYQVEGGITENLIWRGDLLLDQYNEDLRGFPGFVEIVASDLGKLQGLNYVDVDGFPHTGRESQLQIIKNCVQLLGYDLGFACSDAIYEDTMDGNPLTDDPMLQAYADNAWYYPVDSFGQTRLMTAWDVLRSILVSKACRIRQWGGRWHVEQIIAGVPPDPLPVSNFNVAIAGDNGLFQVKYTEDTPMSIVQNLSFGSHNYSYTSFDDNEGVIVTHGGGGAPFVVTQFDKEYNQILQVEFNDFQPLGFRWMGWDGIFYMVGRSFSNLDRGVVIRIRLSDGKSLRKEYKAQTTVSQASICLDQAGRLYGSFNKFAMEFDYQTLAIVNSVEMIGASHGYSSVAPGEAGFVYYVKVAETGAGHAGLQKRDEDLVLEWERLTSGGIIFNHVHYMNGKIMVVGQPNGEGLYVFDTEGNQEFKSGTAANINRKVGTDTFGDIYMSYSISGNPINKMVKFRGSDYEELWDKILHQSSTVTVRDMDIHPGRMRIYNSFEPKPPLESIDVPIVTGSNFLYVGSGDSITVDIPFAQRTGSMLLAVLMHRNAEESGVTAPAGWQLVSSAATPSGGQRVSAYSFIDDASLGSDVTFESAVTNFLGLCVMRIERQLDGALGFGNIYSDTYAAEDQNPGFETIPASFVDKSLSVAVAISTCMNASASSNYSWPDGWEGQNPRTSSNNRRLAVGTNNLESGWNPPVGLLHTAVEDHDSAQLMIIIEADGAETPPATEPAVPHITNFEVIPDDDSVLLRWQQDEFADVAGYRIYQDGVNLGVFVTDKEHTVTGLENFTAYEFQVRAVTDEFVEIRSSDIITQIPYPGAENDFSGYTDDTFPSDWINVNNAAGWRVQSEVLKSVANMSNDVIVYDPANMGDQLTKHTVEAKIRTSGNGANNRVRLLARSDGVNAALTGVNNTYWLALRSGNIFAIEKMVNNSFSGVGAQVTFNYSANTWYRLKFLLDGTTLRGKVWADGDVEPDSYQINRTDASHSSGYCGLGGNTDQLDCDELSIRILP